MDELIARIAALSGTDVPRTESAVRIILNFLHQQGPAETVERLAAQMGASDYLTGRSGGGGLFGRIGGLFGAGGAMAAFSALSAEGLDLEAIQRLTQAFVTVAREEVGDETVDGILAAIPGLAQFV